MKALSNLFHQSSRRLFLTKPRSAFIDDEELEHGLKRNMSLFDLLCVGVGGTIGTGVFVLSGLIARDYAGPSAMFSFLVAGIACLISAASYGELSSRISSAGSSYAYVYAALGEYPAIVAAWSLSLEYGISGSAVSRSWGDKLSSWINSLGGSISTPLDGYGINLFAGLLQLCCVIVLLAGVNTGKLTINIFTVFKVVLVFFMIFGGFALFEKKNLVPLAPMGISGILRGSTSCFFGLIGFDEICCMAAEANDPHVVLPRAVFGTIIIVTLLYCLAAFALVGMQNYQDISSDSCFSDAFRSRGWGWAAQLVSVGELICLPLVALVSFLAQPRIQYAMSIDGLLPKVFGEVDDDGNLYKGIVISGLVCTIIALFVPFTYLDDMISAGVLFSFNLTNTSLVVIRRGRFENSNSSAPYDLCSLLLIVYHVVATALAGLLANIISGNGGSNPVTISFSAFLFLVCFAVGSCIAMNCPENTDPEKRSQYRAPYMPFPPLFGIIINYVLIAQLSMLGIALIVCYYVLATIFYFLYCFQKDDTISMRCYSSLLTPISGRKNSTMSQDSDDFDSHMNNQAYHKVATDADEDNPKYSAEIGKISAHDKVSIKQQPSSPMW